MLNENKKNNFLNNIKISKLKKKTELNIFPNQQLRRRRNVTK
jgi:hypothetical protein